MRMSCKRFHRSWLQKRSGSNADNRRDFFEKQLTRGEFGSPTLCHPFVRQHLSCFLSSLGENFKINFSKFLDPAIRHLPNCRNFRASTLAQAKLSLFGELARLFSLSSWNAAPRDSIFISLHAEGVQGAPGASWRGCAAFLKNFALLGFSFRISRFRGFCR